MLSEERQRSTRRGEIAASLRKGIGISILLVFIAISLLSASYLAEIPNTQALVTPIIAATTGSIVFVLFYRFVFQIGGHLVQGLFGASVIGLTALGIYLFR